MMTFKTEHEARLMAVEMIIDYNISSVTVDYRDEWVLTATDFDGEIPDSDTIMWCPTQLDARMEAVSAITNLDIKTVIVGYDEIMERWYASANMYTEEEIEMLNALEEV